MVSRRRSDPEVENLLNANDFFQNPYPVYTRLRANYPVYWSDSWGQWLVTRHDDVLGVLKNPETFSSSGYEDRLLDKLHREAGEDYPELAHHYRTSVLSRSDPPLHTRLRKMLMDRFTPRFIRGLTPRIEAIVQRTMSGLPANGTIDFIASYAYPIPALVIAELLGLEERVHSRAVEWSQDITAFVGTGSPSPQRAERTDRSLTEFRAALEPLIAERREHPGDDLVSLLVQRGGGTGALNDEEIIATCVTLLFAGHETTANLIGNGMLALLQRPEQLALVREQPEEMHRTVEELLRFDSSVQRVRRVVRHNTKFRGQELRAGDLVMAFLGSANRDPRAHDRPDELNVQRSGSAHVSFGHGIHFCVGAALARVEAPEALRTFLRRFPTVELVPDHPPVWARNLTFRQLASLPLRVSEDDEA